MKKPSINTIIFTLEKHGWDRKLAAKELDCAERTLNNWIADIKKNGANVQNKKRIIKRKYNNGGKDPFDCKCFPSNEYRLESLDRPKGPGAPKYNLWEPDED